MATAAKAFFDSLTDEQKKTAGYEFKHDERLNWYFVPRARKGLPLGQMDEKQRELAKKLLASGMSAKGNDKVWAIISLEPVLKELEQRARPGAGANRDSGLYYWTVFGQPGGKEPWGWRVEGHHVAVNFTIAGEHAAGAPAFLGSNPADVKDGPRKGERPLGEEEDRGRAFVKSLTPQQQKKAIIAEKAFADIITGNQREAKLTKGFEGLPVSEMSAEQKAALMDLVAVYSNRFRTELAAQDMKRIAVVGVDKIYFAWAGSMEKGQGHYYRIHGPTFLIEYDNVQNNANHIHSVWRDLENDFGGDLLKKHYQEHKH
jgi:hypothetical protein